MKITVNTIPPTPPQSVRTFVLELNEDEADLIRALLSDGISWAESGDIGQMARDMYYQLSGRKETISTSIRRLGGDYLTFGRRLL